MNKNRKHTELNESIIIANNDHIRVIKNLLHVKMSTKELLEIRDRIISKHRHAFNSKKLMKNLFIYHYNKSNIRNGKISYNHLLIAEMIYHFVIATKSEYLKKCEEYKVEPFNLSKPE